MSAWNGSLRMPVFAALATATAAICLGRTFLTGSWFFPTVFGVVVVAVGCEVARRFAASRTVVPLGGLVALFGYLLVRYGHDQSYLHLLPTTGTLDRLGDLASRGRQDIARYAAPVGVSPGIEFLTVAGVGLVALAVDTLAVTWRRAALAGLPLLVLYTVPTAIAPGGVNWVAFAVAAIGFLALLLAESRERVSRWGRPMRYITDRKNLRLDAETAPLGQVGRRVGATALGLALVVPAVLPDLSTGAFGFGSGGFGNGGGTGNRVAVVNPILDLGKNLRRNENQPVIEYRGSPTYLRLVGLDTFTGDQWRPSELEVSRSENDVEDGLRTPPGLGPAVVRGNRRYSIKIFDLEQTWLPLPYPAKRVTIDGTWLYDESTFNVFGENTSTRQLEYEVRALAVAPTADQLRLAPDPPASMSRYLELPDDIPDRVEVDARTVVSGLTNDYERALALQDWLRDEQEFTYSTELSNAAGDASGSEAIVAFLDSRRGYCVQFASTMAVMARLLDIPARVAIGFTQGDPVGGKRVVSLHDLHSWPELYFQGSGWIRFEPTPAQRTGSPPSWAQAAANPGDGSSNPRSLPTGEAATSPRIVEQREASAPFEGLEEGTGAGIGAGPGRIPVVPLLVLLAFLALLTVPALTRVVVRIRRWRGAATPALKARAAWADLQDTLTDVGYQWRSSDPPRSGTARLVQEKGLGAEATDALHRLARATEQARYAPAMANEVGDLRTDVETVRGDLLSSAGRWGRWRARVLPRSTRAVSTALSERLADGLDAVDQAVSGLTNRLRPRRS